MANKHDTHLNPQRIKDWMNKRNLKAKDMVSALMAGRNADEWENIRRRWSTIMKTGNVPHEDAERIANALGVSIINLKHPDVEDRIEKLKELIKCAFEKVKAAQDLDGLLRISVALEPEQDETGGEWDTTNDFEYSELAQRACDKIEWLHLFGEPGELESFARLLGVTTQQLRPAALASFWLFSSSNSFGSCHSLGKLVSGHAEVLAEIKKNWEALPDMFRERSETIKATVRKEGTRYRLRFESSNISALSFSCLFYACDTTAEAGLTWTVASTWEHEKLMTSLEDFLFDHADTVEMEGKQFPPKSSRAVFQVQFFDVDENGRKVLMGKRIFDHRKIIHESLKTLLKKHDAENFLPHPSPTPHSILILQYENQRGSKHYDISFGWLVGQDEFHIGPWPKISREQFIKSVRNIESVPYLTDQECHTWQEFLAQNEDYEIPPFEPELDIRLVRPENANDVFQVHFFTESNSDYFDEVPLRKEIFDNLFLLHYSLQTFLEQHGEAKWRFWSPDSHIFHGVRMQLPEKKYCRIYLGWLDDKGAFQEGTWSKNSRAEFIEKAQDLQNKFMYVPNENEVIPSFEPEQQVSAVKGVAA